MHATKRRSRWLVVPLLFILAAGVAVAALGGFSTPKASATTAAKSCGTYTTAQVDKAMKRTDYTPVFKVPRCIAQQHLSIAFINPGLSLSPVFVDWSNSMRAAAKFYGVTFRDVDLGGKFDQIQSAYNALTTGKKPDVIGALAPTMFSVVPVAKKDGIPFLAFDRQAPGAYYYGVGQVALGRIGGGYLGPAVAKRLKGAWKGRPVVYMSVTQSSDVGINQEMAVGRAAFHKSVPAATDVSVDNQVCDQSDAQASVAAALTAHPNQVIAILACNDEAGVGAYDAARTAGRLKDVAIVTIGGDALAQQTMKGDTSGAYVGAVYIDSYAEGWGWVEAALAVHLHKHFVDYTTHSFITPASVRKK